MDVQVVHHQMDRGGFRVGLDDGFQSFSELGGRAIGRDESEMPSRAGLHGAESISRATSFIFVVRSPGLARCHRPGRSHIGMQRNGLLINADYGFGWIIEPLVHLQDVFHLYQILVGEVGHAPHLFPATAGGRGVGEGLGWSHDLHAEPVFV